MDLSRMTKEQKSVFVFQPRDAGTGRGVVVPKEDIDFFAILGLLLVTDRSDRDLGFRLMSKESWTFIHKETRRTWCAIRLRDFYDQENNTQWSAIDDDLTNNNRGFNEGLNTTTVLVPRDDLVADEKVYTTAPGSQQLPPLMWLPLTGKEVRLVVRKPQGRYDSRFRLVGFHAHTAPVDPVFLSQSQEERELSVMDQCILQWMFSGGLGIEHFAEITRHCALSSVATPGHLLRFAIDDAASSARKSDVYRTNKDHVKCVVENHLPLYAQAYGDFREDNTYFASRAKHQLLRRTSTPPQMQPRRDRKHKFWTRIARDMLKKEKWARISGRMLRRGESFEKIIHRTRAIFEEEESESDYHYVKPSIPFGNLEFAEPWAGADGKNISHEELADRYFLYYCLRLRGL